MTSPFYGPGARYGSEFGGVAAALNGAAANHEAGESNELRQEIAEKKFLQGLEDKKTETAARVASKRAKHALDLAEFQWGVYNDNRDFDLEKLYKTAGANKYNSETQLNDQALKLNEGTVAAMLAGDHRTAAAMRAGTKYGGDASVVARTSMGLDQSATDDQLMSLASMFRNVGTDSAFSTEHQSRLRLEDVLADQLKGKGSQAPATVNGSVLEALSEQMAAQIDRGQGEAETIADLLAKNPGALNAAAEAYQSNRNVAAAAKAGLASAFGGTPELEGTGWFDGSARLVGSQPSQAPQGIAGRSPGDADLQKLMNAPDRRIAAIQFIEAFGMDEYNKIRAQMQ